MQKPTTKISDEKNYSIDCRLHLLVSPESNNNLLVFFFLFVTNSY